MASLHPITSFPMWPVCAAHSGTAWSAPRSPHVPEADMHELPPEKGSWGFTPLSQPRAVGPQQATHTSGLAWPLACLLCPVPPPPARPSGPKTTAWTGSWRPQQNTTLQTQLPAPAPRHLAGRGGRLATGRNPPPEKGVSRSALSKSRVFSGHGAERRSQKTLWALFPEWEGG